MTEKMRRRIALALSAALSIFNILHMFVGGLLVLRSTPGD